MTPIKIQVITGRSGVTNKLNVPFLSVEAVLFNVNIKYEHLSRDLLNILLANTR